MNGDMVSEEGRLDALASQLPALHGQARKVGLRLCFATTDGDGCPINPVLMLDCAATGDRLIDWWPTTGDWLDARGEAGAVADAAGALDLATALLRQFPPPAPGERPITAADVRRAYLGSDGRLTTRLFVALEAASEHGFLATLLFRAQKASARAKKYRGGRDTGDGYRKFRDLAYDRKGDALKMLAEFLDAAGCTDGRYWGWGRDNDAGRYANVLYVETPVGQCSFHSPARYAGPDWRGKWRAGQRSEETVLLFCESVLLEAAL